MRDLKEFVTSLRRELDYVAPVPNLKEGFAQAKAIEDSFAVGRVSREALEMTAKGGLSKEAFMINVE